MFKRTFAALAIAAAATAVAFAAESVSVKPVRVEETRSRDLGPAKDTNFFSNSPALRIVMHVDGDLVKGATSYGKVIIAEATDDAGTDLKPKKEKGFMSFGRGEDDFEKIDRFPGMRKPDAKPAGFDLGLQLAASSRKATRVKSLKGEFQVLAGGEAKQLSITKLTGLVGKTLDDPALKAAGLEVKIVNPKDSKFPGGAARPSLILEVSGNANALQKIAIVDAAGQSVSDESMTMMNTTHLTLNKALDDTMKLQLSLNVGQKTVTVPFDAQNIELP
jgi:hypothetical protein